MVIASHTHKTLRLLACALLLAFLPCVVACSYSDDEQALGRDALRYFTRRSDPYYRQDAFSRSGGRITYDDGTTVAQSTGVDVSDHQGAIDWNAVAADGIDFAFVRVGYRGTTEGGLYPDACFDSNYQAAHDAGIACGAYFFSQATTVEEAEEEAAFVLGLLAGRQLEYPVAFDYEVMSDTRISGIDSQTAAQIGDAFCSAIRAGGYEPMAYGNTHDLDRLDAEWLEGYPIWFAEYDGAPSFESKLSVWQYTNQGYVSGIQSLVDLNLDLSNVGQWEGDDAAAAT